MLFTKEARKLAEPYEALVECSYCGASGLYTNNKRMDGSDGGFIFLKNKIIRCKNHNFVIIISRKIKEKSDG